MTIETITKLLQAEFDILHAKFKTISTTHLKELYTELTTWQQKGLISKKFYQQNYGFFSFHPPDNLQKARSIVIIGIPQKIIPLEFSYKGKRYQTIIPPTYQYAALRTRCNDILSTIIGKNAYHVDRAILPMKLLAVRSGLGKYGKNNLCYVDGMGSVTRLEAFYTDYAFTTDDWCEEQLMDCCNTCNRCIHACPTKAIPDKRILIHADKCLTYLNENQGNFPPWVPPHSHNAVVGCMHCQIVCPQNKKFLEPDRNTISFTEEETTIILQKTPHERIPQTLAEKITDLGLDEYYPLLERNLSVLMY